MSLAARTREAARRRPFLVAALRAGVVNYTAAARTLDVDDDEDAVATALRRFADDLPPAPDPPNARVSMQSGVGPSDDAEAGDAAGEEAALLAVDGTAYAADGGDLTAVLATGDVDATALADALARLRVADVAVEAAAGSDGHLVVLVARRDGANAVRAVEDALQG
jgi:hypothetical protein